MGVETLLAQMGYRPAGSGSNSRIGEILSSLAEVNKTMQDAQTKEAEEKQKKFDTFKTLRDAGYSSQQAYELILKGTGLPAPEGEGTTSIDKQQKEANLAKTKAETEKIGKEKTSSLRDRILGKVAAGEDLLPGEQKIYDDTIKRRGDNTDEVIDFGGGSDMPGTVPAGARPAKLPKGVTEEDIQHTLELHPEFTRESLLKKLGAQ
jgi:hypothetical protein